MVASLVLHFAGATDEVDERGTITASPASAAMDSGSDAGAHSLLATTDRPYLSEVARLDAIVDGDSAAEDEYFSLPASYLEYEWQ